MKNGTRSRLLAWLLMAAMILTMVPTAIFAAGSATYTKITNMEELTSGQYVLAVQTGYGLGVLDGSWITAEAMDATVDAVTDPLHPWTLTVDGDGVRLTDCNGVSVAPTGGNDSGITSGDYSWTVTCTDGTFRFAGQGEDTVILASNKGSGSKFRAYKSTTVNGNPNGYPSDFTLYKLSGGTPVEPTEPTDPVEPTEPEKPEALFDDGDRVVIYNPVHGKALSTTYTGFYNNGTDVTLENGVLTGYTESDIWTVGVNDDGTYTFSTADGQKLAMGESYSSMPLDEVYSDWSVTEAAADGCYYIQNTGRGLYLEWYADKGNWSAYGSITEETESLFAQAFYKVPDARKEGFVTELHSGDRVIVYNPESSVALSQVYNGFYNTGAALTLTDGKLTGYSDTEIWTVGVNEDGSYTLSTQDGRKLAMGESFSSTPLDEVNPDWQITPAATEGCFYIQNAARGLYLEWYAEKNNWSAYGSITEATEGLFAHRFYLVPETTEEPVPSGPLAQGDRVVIYNPANLKALSTTYNGFYNNGTDVVLNGDQLSGFTAADVWTVGVNEDGSYTFSTEDGQKLSMGESFTSTPLDDVYSNWNLLPAATGGCYYIQNTVRGNYLEWYAEKNNWSSYSAVTDEALFAQAFYKVTGDLPDPDAGLPEAGDQVVLFNQSAQGVLACQDDNAESPSIENAPASVADGKATAANGALVFTVEKNGGYYRFVNETFGYLCSNGTGNNAFYQTEPTEDADWTLAAYNGGYTLESRTAKFNGQYAQFLEYYAGSYKSYSMYNVTDPDIYTFHFYPCANTSLTGGVVNAPAVVFGTLADAFLGQAYSLTFTVDAVFGVQDLQVSLNGDPLAYTEADGVYTLAIPAASVTGESLQILITGTDTKGVTFQDTADIPIKDEPVIDQLTPAAGSQTGDNLRPTISAAVSNAGENPAVTMTVAGTPVDAVYADGRVSYTPEADLAQGRTSVTVTVTRSDGKSAGRTWSFTVGTATEQLYFGQLHSHTTYSDGSGSLESALDYVAGLPDSANVDFVAFTDHSNYFDKSGDANPEGALYDMSLATAYSQQTWAAYKQAVADFNASQSDVVAIAGFEMTWSGGPGHINTFNTPGIVSRNNTTLNNKTADAGMKAYYALLSQPEGAGSLSQFNHPGSTFGTFTDFSYWDALIDSRIFLVEVGNGEGAIGAGGYYPSYEYYTMALDKGWHVAPTNNQDNHKGKWGNANDARDVILTDDFSEEGIYQAIRDLKVYSTEDKNLEIYYTVNGLPLGSIIEEVPETLEIAVQLFDPDASDSISKVEVVVNSGKVAYTWDDPAVLATGELTCTLDPTYSYYYIRVTQGDGDLAVTAPVWVGETLKLGISSVECDTATPVTGEELEIETTLFNSESQDAQVTYVTYTTDGSVVLGSDTTGYTVPASGTQTLTFSYTPETAKVMTITVTVGMELDGVDYEFSMDVELDVLNADELVYVGIDASHYNEYVAGNYQDSMGNFGNLAAEYSVRTVELKTSEELIAACSNEKYKMLILTAPSRRDGSALRDPYATYSDEEIQAIVRFNQAGGAVVLAGWSDYYEHYADFPAADHMAAQQNKVLEALGSSLRIGDDATNDDSLNGGQTQRLYFSTYNWDSFLMDGVEFDPEHPNDNMYSQLFSQYGGASIYAVDGEGNPTTTLPDTVTPVVYGHATTYSKDSDNDGLGGDGMPKYPVAEGDNRLMVLGTEELEGQGLIVVSGAAFMSNFEVQATISDSNAEKNYSNYDICENLVQYVNPVVVTDIATVQQQTEKGFKYTIQGVVTSNASGFDQDTAFFDCIYVQDETAGICCFPVAGDYRIGDVVRMTGTTDFYQGEMELQVSSVEKLGHTEPVAPKTVTAAQVNDGSVLGSLITLQGTVERFELANGLVQTIMVRDAQGDTARVFIDGYITTAQDVENLEVGCAIAVTGVASYDNTFNAPEGPFPRIRVRNRADVVCTAQSEDLEALLAAAQAAAQAAKEAQEQAEAAQAAAEAAQKAAEEAAASAAEDKEAAENAQAAAEAAQAKAEAAKAAAETAQKAAEDAAAAAEASNLAAAQEAQKAAEEAALAAGSAAEAAKSAEAAAQAQKGAQEAQAAAEAAQAKAEEAQKAAEEAAGATAEDKAAAEAAQAKAEEAQAKAEEAQAKAEEAKAAAAAAAEAAEASNLAAAQEAQKAAAEAAAAAESAAEAAESAAKAADAQAKAQAAQAAAEAAQKVAEEAQQKAEEAQKKAEEAADTTAEDREAAERAAEEAEEAQAAAESAQAAAEEAQAAAEAAKEAAEAANQEAAASAALAAEYAQKVTETYGEIVKIKAEMVEFLADAQKAAEEAEAAQKAAEEAQKKAEEAALASAKYYALMELIQVDTSACNAEQKQAVEAVQAEAREAVEAAESREEVEAILAEARKALQDAMDLVCASEMFEDVALDAWYHEGVDYMVRGGYMEGVSSGIFGINSKLTRGQLATILYRIAGEPSVEGLENPFEDVQAGRYFTEAVIWAAGEGIVEGTSEGIFRPEKMVTREQLATILYRYSGESAVEEDVLAGYPDGEKVSTFAKEGMNWAVSKGLITGVANGTVTTLNPRGAATRAQIATILMRFLENQ